MTENMVGHKLGEFAPTRHVQGTHDEGGREGGAAAAARRRAGGAAAPAAAAKRRGASVMIQAHATARYVRTSAQKAGLVLDLIRGKDVNRALATLRVHAQVGGRGHREGAAVGDRQRAAEGRVQRRRRPAVRVGVLRQPGAVAEARAAGADGPRVPRAEAHRAPHGAGRPSGRRRSSPVGATAGAPKAPRPKRARRRRSRRRRRRSKPQKAKE